MLRLRLLGGLTLFAGDSGRLNPVGLTRNYRLALLAILGIAGETGVSREAIEALLWPESPEGRAGGSLSQALYGVRRDVKIGDVIECTGGHALRLNPERIVSDVWQFEAAVADGRLEEAIETWGGEFLSGFHIRGSAEFDDWAAAQRSRLGEQMDGCLERLATAESATGNTDRALGLWRKRAQRDPLDSRVARCVVKAFRAAGDDTGALRHAHGHLALVERELGMAPDEDLIRLASGSRAITTPVSYLSAITSAEMHVRRP